MPGDGEITIRLADWHRDRRALRHIREQVFVQEQAVPPAEEWDELDAVACHFLAEHAGRAVACGRLLASGKIGRLAVLPDFRGRGLGGRILDHMVAHALAGNPGQLYLHAQVHALGFYLRHGFVAEGEEFLEAGIRHRLMNYSPATRR